MTTIEGLEFLNTSEVTSMNDMFHGCNKLTSLDLSNFNTAKVTEMIAMFNGCEALQSVTLPDSLWRIPADHRDMLSTYRKIYEENHYAGGHRPH